MSTYIQYSTRHNITDKDLAGLLDYCERTLGWDIGEDSPYEDLIHNFDMGKCTISIWSDDEVQILYGNLDLRIPKDLFYRTYCILLPEMRDLYSNNPSRV